MYKVNRINIPHTPFPVINSVLEDKAKGHIIELKAFNTIWIIHDSGFSYLMVNDKSDSPIETVVKTWNMHSELPDYIHFYDQSLSETAKAYLIQHEIGFKQRERLKFNYHDGNISFTDHNDEITFTEMLPQNTDQLIGSFQNWKQFWGTVNNFFKHSFGSVAIVDNEVVSMCYAAGIDEQSVEIDVITDEHNRGKGLAKKVTSQFMNECLKRGLMPQWDCFIDNTPSVKLAESLGFKRKMKYPFLSIYNKR